MPVQFNQIKQASFDPVGRLQKIQDVALDRQAQQQQLQAGSLNLQNARKIATEHAAIDNAFKTARSDDELDTQLARSGQAGAQLAMTLKTARANLSADQARQAAAQLQAQQTKLQIDSEDAMKVYALPPEQQETAYAAMAQRHPDWPQQYAPGVVETLTLQKDINDHLLKVAQRKASEESAAKTKVETENLQNKPIEVSPGAVLFDPKTKLPIFTAPKPATPETPHTVTTDQGVMQWNPKTGAYDIKVGNRPPTATETAMKTLPPGDWEKTGQDFLATIPAQWRTTVKKVANYDEDPTKVASMRGGSREQIMQWVNQVNPSYDSTMFGNRAPTRKAFTVGTQGQQINAINTAIGHIDQITGLASKLGNGNFVPGNEFYNWAKTTFGSDAVTNFDTLKDALAGEVSSVLSKGGATVSGIADAKQKIKAASSPQQLAGYVKTLLPVMGSKLEALNYQYHQAMGETDPFSALSPESKSVLRKNGIDPDRPLGGGSNGFSVTVGAKTYTFKDQQSLDAFKKEAGL